MIRCTTDYQPTVDMRCCRLHYADSNHQPMDYPSGPPDYLRQIRHHLDQLTGPNVTVFEFGCGSGRNFPHLRPLCSGMDLNVRAVEYGRTLGRNILLGDDQTFTSILPNLRSRAAVGLTISALSHLADPWLVFSALQTFPITVCYELWHPEWRGKVVTMDDESGNEVQGYPYSYFHDYPAMTNRHLQSWSIPAFRGNLGEHYKLMIWSYK